MCRAARCCRFNGYELESIMIHEEFDKQSIGKDRIWPGADDHFRYYNQTGLKSRVNQTYGKNYREEEVIPGLNYMMRIKSLLRLLRY